MGKDCDRGKWQLGAEVLAAKNVTEGKEDGGPKIS